MKQLEWHNEKRKISDLIPYESNPRQLTDKQYNDLKKSLTKFNLAEIPAINLDNKICAGHQRLKIMSEVYGNDFEIDVRVPNRKLTEKEFQEYNIRSNKNTGEFSFDILANEFEIDELLEWGFEEKELDLDLWNDTDESKLDEVPEVPEKAVSKLGDLFEIDGRHRVMCGDSTKAEDVEKLMDGKKAEILFTSPPYSDMRTYNNADVSLEKLIQFIPAFSKHAKYFLVNLGIKIKDSEIVQYWDEYIAIFKKEGFKFMCWNVWDKGETFSIGQAKATLFPISHEFVFIFGNDKKETNKIIPKQTSNDKRKVKARRQQDGSMKFSSVGDTSSSKKKLFSVLSLNAEMTNQDVKHPAKFPVKLPELHILSMTDIDNIVTDSFLGSGTTLIACEQTKRKCFGMELDPHYIDVILRRYMNLYPEANIKCLNNPKFNFKNLISQK